jgi:hypothetical protein
MDMKHIDLTITLATLALASGAGAEQTVGVFINEPEALLGYTLFAPQSTTETWLIDNDGNEVHVWPSDAKPRTTAGSGECRHGQPRPPTQNALDTRSRAL